MDVFGDMDFQMMVVTEQTDTSLGTQLIQVTPKVQSHLQLTSWETALGFIILFFVVVGFLFVFVFCFDLEIGSPDVDQHSLELTKIHPY